jgi:hypothetical protein
VKYVKHFDRVTDNPIEDQIVTIYPAAYPYMFKSRNQCITTGRVDQRFTAMPKLLHECQRACRIVPGNPVTDCLKVGFGRAGDNNDYRALAADLRYLASSRSNTFANGFTRPASASAIPRAIAASSAVSRASRS